MNAQTIIDKGITYGEYHTLIDFLLKKNLTTGNTQSEQLLTFTKLNVQRMQRLEKTIVIPTDIIEKLKTKKPHVLILIAEAWCGDCAQITPVINKMVEASEGKLSFKIILRDENPEIMDAYLTNGSRSVPKLILIDPEYMTVTATWGPRPVSAQNIILHWKANKETITWEEFEKELHTWYTKNKGLEIMQELEALL